MTVLSILSDWACKRARIESPSALERARHALEDALACIVAGSGDRAAAAVRASFFRQEGGAATVFGGGRADATLAALANGTAAHALDYDDVLIAGSNHAGAVLTAALLALAEEQKLGGADLLDAFIVGIQLHVGIARAIMPGHYLQGWHTTSTIGCIGTAGACARLLGCDKHVMLHAMAIAASMAGGTKVQFGTPCKPLHAGLAAHNAIQAVRLASAGITANPAALEGDLGFGALTASAEQPADWSKTEQFIAEDTLAIEGVGLMFKKYPCCGSNARVLDILLELRDKEGFAVDDIQAIDAEMSDMNVQNLMYHTPANEIQGRFSLQYAVAVALRRGAVTLADFVPGAVDRPGMRELFSLTRLKGFGAPTYPGQPDVRRPHKLRIRLKSGKLLEGECADPKGTSGNPFTEVDRKGKFTDCTSWILSPRTIDQVREMLARFDALPSVASLTVLLNYHATVDDGQRFVR